MTDLITADEAGKLAHKYRFANNDLERVLCETARTVTALHAQIAEAEAAQAMVRDRAEKAEAERVSEWNKRRDADSSRNVARAACDTMRADRDRLAAANAVLEAKVAALREAVDEQTKARAQHWLRRTMTAPEDAEVEALCERCGYGAVMDAASRLWARKPHGSGAFYIGGCIGFKSDEEARAALAEVQADARRDGGEECSPRLSADGTYYIHEAGCGTARVNGWPLEKDRKEGDKHVRSSDDGS